MEAPGLPNDFMFQRIVHIAHERLQGTHGIIRDHHGDQEANYAKLLTDVLELQEVVFKKLSDDTRKALSAGQDVIILLSAPAGYEWLVAFLTVLSLGAVIAPISGDITEIEITELAKETSAAGILLATHSSLSANDLSEMVACPVVPVNEWLLAHRFKPQTHFQIKPEHQPDASRAGYLLFTSGSTSRPKGVLHSRQTFAMLLGNLLHTGAMTGQDTLIYTFASNLASGIVYCLFALVVGANIDFSAGVWTAEWMWGMIREGRVTVMVDQPSRYKEMAEFYWSSIALLPRNERHAYLDGLRSFRWPAVSGSQATESVRKAWNTIPGVVPLIITYGMTEVSGITGTLPRSVEFSEKCTGYLLPGVEANLEDGEMGELLVRTPNMFMGYYKRPDLTKSAFDEDGFFKTGDIFQRNGAKYYMYGRASVDVIHCQGHLVFAIDVENAISSLSYVQDVYVIPISTGLAGKQVAAVIRPVEGSVLNNHITLDRLRHDLQVSGLDDYQMPTVIRFTAPDTRLPIGTGGKKGKAQAIKQYFPEAWEVSLDREKA